MKRRLFLTGEMGCGKSTAILTAVGEKLPQFGGFLTRRVRDEAGKAISFFLTSPDGARKSTFLDCSGPKPKMDLQVFKTLGVELLGSGAAPDGIATPVCAPARNDRYILDEIGGMELLCPEFLAALERVLASDAPVLGVLKGEGPASAMIRRLGLAEDYETAAKALRHRLMHDENTLVYQCAQFDPQALALAEQWVKEYAHE